MFLTGCETMYPCTQPELCSRCCSNYKAAEDIDLCYTKELSHRCFYCGPDDECAVVQALSMNRTTMCNDDGSPEKCYTHVKDGKVTRGCYSLRGDLAAECAGNTSNCQVCASDMCNGKSIKTFCYFCGLANNRCQFDQEGSLVVDCPSLTDVQLETGCVIATRWVKHKCF